MAVNYSLPSWLEQTPDFAGKFLSGVQIGAAIGEARNKLAAAQQQNAVENQQKQQQIEASALKEAQESRVSQAYNDQQIALKQQQLQIADEKVGEDITKAARQYQAQQQYQKDYNAALSENPDDEEGAARSAMFKNLSMFGTGAGGAGIARALSKPARGPSIPQFLTDPESGARLAYNQETGRFIHLQQPKAVGATPDWLTRHSITRQDKLSDERRKELSEGRYGAYLKGEAALSDDIVKDAGYQKAKVEWDSLGTLKSATAAPQAAPASLTPTATATQPAIVKPTNIKSIIPRTATTAQPAAQAATIYDPTKIPVINVTGRQLADSAAALEPQIKEQVSQTARPVKISQWHYDHAGGEQYGQYMPQLNQHYLDTMNEATLVDAAKSLGIQGRYLDGKIQTWTGSDWTKSKDITRDKLERMILDIAEEKQLMIE